MADPDAAPTQPSPEDGLEPVRDQSHEETGLPDRVKELEEKLASREKELIERLARLQADFDNYRRRAREDAGLATARGKEQALRAFLPLLDNLERALAHSEDAGLKLLSRQLEEVLRTQGVTVLAPEGEPFDARVHEAIAQETREGVKAGLVLTVVEKGYSLDGRVLRPARVVVAS